MDEYFVVATVDVAAGEWDFQAGPLDKSWADLLLRLLADGPFKVMKVSRVSLGLGICSLAVTVRVSGDWEFGSEVMRDSWADTISREFVSDPWFRVLRAKAVLV